MGQGSKYPENLDQPGLKRAGEIVRARLAGNPAVYTVPVEQAELYAVGDFLSADECARMIALIDAVAQPSTLYELDYSSGFRTSYSGNVDPFDPFVRKIGRRIDDLLGLPPSHGESIQGQRYMPGQEFRPHHDWFHPGTSYWDKEMARGGQRSFTAMAYLNNVEEGGTTSFPELEIALEPKQGVLVVWNNALPDGQTNPRALHAAVPVVRGQKYVITKWYRARPWS